MQAIRWFENTWKNPRWWDTIHLFKMWQGIQAIWRKMIEYTLMRDHLAVKSVKTNSSSQLTCKNREESTLLRISCSKCYYECKRLGDLQRYKSIQTDGETIQLLKCDKKFKQSGHLQRHERSTLMRNHLAASIATRSSVKLSIWRSMKESTFEELLRLTSNVKKKRDILGGRMEWVCWISPVGIPSYRRIIEGHIRLYPHLLIRFWGLVLPLA